MNVSIYVYIEASKYTKHKWCELNIVMLWDLPTREIEILLIVSQFFALIMPLVKWIAHEFEVA